DLSKFDKMRVCLVDLKSNQLRQLGPEGDYSRVAWLDDNKHLAVVRTETIADINARRRYEVVIMDIDGNAKLIGFGRDIIALPKNRLLYFRPTEKQWVSIKAD